MREGCRRVLMISPHFPPDSTAATHRVRLLAPHLPAYGWDPTVLTVDAGDYEGRLDPALAESVPSGLRVIRARAWPARMTRAVGIGDLGLRSWWSLRRSAQRELRIGGYDAVYITIYPTYPALLGPGLKRRFGVAFVLDYQDPWVGEWGRSVGAGPGGRADFKSRASRRFAAALEPVALRAADGVTAVSRTTFEQALARTPQARPMVTEELPIGWDRRDLSFVSGRAPGDPAHDGLIHVSYVGTLLPTGLETLRSVLVALARARAADPAVARVRLDFFGTSNQRTSDAPSRVMPIAQEIGVADVVTEIPARLDYFDALRVLRDSSAVLLMGSGEPHYTPSKVFPALLAERPVLAVYHADSTATPLLQRFGRPPSVRVVAYDAARPVDTAVDDIACHLREIAADPPYRSDRVNPGVLEPSSAPALAARLANVFDRVVAGR